MKNILLVLLLLSVFTACQNNKLKTSEIKLAQEILNEEKILAHEETLRLEKEKLLADSIAKLPKGFRFKEDRSVDLSCPPITFDIIGARNKVKPFKYSDWGRKISYKIIHHPLDSLFFSKGTQVLVTPNNFIFSSNKGIASFDKNGQFIETICDNIYTENATHQFYDYVGSRGKLVVIGNKLIYTHRNSLEKTKRLMCYDVSKGRKTLQIGTDIEFKKVIAKGDIISELSQKNVKSPLMLNENLYFLINRLFRSSENGISMVLYSKQGDTLCTVQDHDPIRNFTSTVVRGSDSGDYYRYNGKACFRQSFNDTIFCAEGVNRFIPKYVINYGDKGIGGSNNGVNPKVDLINKFVPDSFIETPMFVFLTYTQDYSCPNTAKKGSLKYNKFIYDKITGDSYHAYIDAKPHLPKFIKTRMGPPSAWPSAPLSEGIINDIDAGPALWDFQQVFEDKVYYKSSVKTLKKHIRSNAFKTSATNAELLIQIAERSNINDIIIMIIE